MSVQGSCLCGGISYSYSGEKKEIAMCHCQQCRKAQGSAFGANMVIDKAYFLLIDDNMLLKEFESSADKIRSFCSHCGSPLYSYRKSIPGKLRLRIGTLDTKITQAVNYHAFYDAKAEWYEANDTLEKFPKAKP
jgi:hypothetical protein